jgi:hypothetical protein
MSFTLKEYFNVLGIDTTKDVKAWKEKLDVFYGRLERK